MTAVDMILPDDDFGFPVFPAADVFPMMAEDELQELAEDIKANGLREPIVMAVIDEERVLVDGRNRLAAWKLAGQPTDGVPFVMLDEDVDPTAYVISANVRRRQMTKAQIAMCVAMVYPEPKRGPGNVDPAKETETVSYTRIKQARTVLRYSPDLAQRVKDGAIKLDPAYEEAIRTKREAAGLVARKAEIARVHPDLAVKIEEGELSIAAAETEAAERARKKTEDRNTTFRDFKTGLEHVGQLAPAAEAEDVRRIFAESRSHFRGHFNHDDTMIDAAIADFRKGSALIIELLGSLKESNDERE